MNIDKQPLVSICCVSYNHAEYIPEAIKSFWNQEYKNIEILALDDGSTDGTLEKLREYSAQDPRIKVIARSVNGGSAAAGFNRA